MALHRMEERARGRGLADDAVALLRTRHEARRQQFPANLTDGVAAAKLAGRLRLDLIAAEREHLLKLLRDGKITDESRRKIERELDLEEASIECREEGR